MGGDARGNDAHSRTSADRLASAPGQEGRPTGQPPAVLPMAMGLPQGTPRPMAVDGPPAAPDGANPLGAGNAAPMHALPTAGTAGTPPGLSHAPPLDPAVVPAPPLQAPAPRDHGSRQPTPRREGQDTRGVGPPEALATPGAQAPRPSCPTPGTLQGADGPEGDAQAGGIGHPAGGSPRDRHTRPPNGTGSALPRAPLDRTRSPCGRTSRAAPRAEASPPEPERTAPDVGTPYPRDPAPHPLQAPETPQRSAAETSTDCGDDTTRHAAQSEGAPLHLDGGGGDSPPLAEQAAQSEAAAPPQAATASEGAPDHAPPAGGTGAPCPPLAADSGSPSGAPGTGDTLHSPSRREGRADAAPQPLPHPEDIGAPSAPPVAPPGEMSRQTAHAHLAPEGDPGAAAAGHLGSSLPGPGTTSEPDF